MNYLVIILTAFAAFTSCESKETASVESDKFGETITLKVGESVTIQESVLTVVFKEVKEDSRCPTGTDCFWEGQAVINLAINETETAEVIMRAGKADLAKDTLDEVIYTLIAVTPYPDAKGVLPIPSEEYEIELKAEQL